MPTCAMSDALRLLRAVNVTQSHGSVGTRVVPAGPARTAWLEPGTDRYDEASWHLLWQGALAADHTYLRWREHPAARRPGSYGVPAFMVPISEVPSLVESNQPTKQPSQNNEMPIAAGT
jgi:hypothetical protein